MYVVKKIFNISTIRLFKTLYLQKITNREKRENK